MIVVQSILVIFAVFYEQRAIISWGGGDFSRNLLYNLREKTVRRIDDAYFRLCGAEKSEVG